MNSAEKATLLFLLRQGLTAFVLISLLLLGLNILMQVAMPLPRILVIASVIAPLWAVIALVLRDGHAEPSEGL